MEQVEAYLREHREDAVKELCEFLRIPSISADPAHAGDVRTAAEWLRERMASAGLTAELVETPGNPIVYGEWVRAPGKPTALVYGHYDVQPPDPLEEWVSPPFEPTVREGKLFARGATDDKGQMFTHVKSVAAWLQTFGELPVNVKFVIEGEEEVGSRNLEDFLSANRDRVACDVAVVSDTSQYAPGMPAITYGLRGIIACEVTLRGPKQDLHSGMFGGAVTNPANVLSRLVGGLHDAEGRVTIPGFYDDVVPLSDGERERLAALPFDAGEFFAELGVEGGHGEAGYSILEQRWARPTCDVNGFVSGYTGEGPKTIVPAWAKVKLSCRLVPEQDPVAIGERLETYFRDHLPAGVALDFRAQTMGRATVFDTDSPWMSSARNAVRDVFGTEPVLIREGGTIPIVGAMSSILGIDVLLLGWGQDTDNLHAPNEHFRVEDFHAGTMASARMWHELSVHSS